MHKHKTQKRINNAKRIDKLMGSRKELSIVSSKRANLSDENKLRKLLNSK
jgi:hypothetical protein